jgi:putative polyketide hydroxylase
MKNDPIVIVGAGPAGLTMALMLARFGTRSTIIERREKRSDHPRAHYVNTRTMELLRQWGVEDEVLAGAFPPEFMPLPLMEMMGGPSMEMRHSISPSIVTSVAQDVVEIALENKLLSYGLTDIHWGVGVSGLTNSAEGVELALTTSNGEAQTLTARWCVACDGANSTIRKQLGIEMIGHPNLDSILNIYFFGPIGGVDDVPSLGTQSIDSQVPGAFICMDGYERHTFQYMMGDTEKAEDFDFESAEKLIRRASGMPATSKVVVKAISAWTMTAHVADSMTIGSVFLVGDAAHAFPPSGGFGMNSGIADSHNLAWKLQAMLDGKGGAGLPASYEAERQPVAFLNTAQSFRNSKTMNLRGVPKPFSLSEGTLELIDKRATKSVISVAAMAEEGDAREMLEMVEHVAALGQELGYAYDVSSVIIPDGSPAIQNTVASYTQNAAPGARAPHLWLIKANARTPIMDLFDRDLVLLTSTNGDAWRQAAKELAINWPLSAAGIGPGLDYEAEGVDFLELYGIGADGAVLVRPDGHVSFRSHGNVSDPRAVLEQALKTSLGY